jgi:uncharacterized protein (DUF488 family)
MAQFFTIGHSTRSTEELIAILQAMNIELLVDVRAIPRSRTNPQFNSDCLAQALASHGIEYVHMPELGGRRGKQHTAEVSPNGFWQNQSFRNYADYALTGAFRAAFSSLRKLGQSKRCAVMCSEAVWWRCHRRIITDYLIFSGDPVVHLLSIGKSEIAEPTPAAVPRDDGTVIYPPQ